jgi:hypothetical protein
MDDEFFLFTVRKMVDSNGTGLKQRWGHHANCTLLPEEDQPLQQQSQQDSSISKFQLVEKNVKVYQSKKKWSIRSLFRIAEKCDMTLLQRVVLPVVLLVLIGLWWTVPTCIRQLNFPWLLQQSPRKIRLPTRTIVTLFPSNVNVSGSLPHFFLNYGRQLSVCCVCTLFS